MRLRRITFVACVLFTIASTAALAGGVVTLLESALVLEGQYEDLEAEIDNCPNGTCSEANDLAADLDALGQELASLQASIAACGCSNATLDAVMQNIEAMDSDLNDTVGSL